MFKPTVLRSVEGAETMASGMYKIIMVLVANATNTDCSSCESQIKIWWNERAELGPLIVWARFIINVFSNEFSQWMLTLVRNSTALHTYFREHLRGRCQIPSGMITGSKICKN